jgi:hypothetical protein
MTTDVLTKPIVNLKPNPARPANYWARKQRATEPECRTWASLWRVFESCPSERKPDVFLLMAQYASDTGLLCNTFADACRRADRRNGR